MSSSSPHQETGQNSISSLMEKNGEKITIQPGALDIIWGNDCRYWNVPSDPKDPVELLQVCWLEVSGSLELSNLNSSKEYTVSFIVSMKPDAFGWTDSPVYLMAKAGKGTYNWKKADLSGKKPWEQFRIPVNPVQKIKIPSDKVDGDKLQFGMYEIWNGRWKGGLIIHGVIIEPIGDEPQA